MKRSISALLLVIYFFECTAAFLNLLNNLKFEKEPTTFTYTEEDVGEALYLTSYIESGKIEEARNKSFVQHPDLKNVESYAGFFTINKTFDKNTYFWFFPSQRNPKEDPVMLWMIGGPGISVFLSIFTYNGPLHAYENQTMEIRKDCYTTNHSVIYIDSPIGSGYSFAKNESGYATNTDDVSRDVLQALIQFFKLFPEYKQNKFVVGGDSYAGKYVATVAAAIAAYNNKTTDKINLKDLVIGNGFVNPKIQTKKADFLNQVGLFDDNERDVYTEIEKNPSGRSQLLSDLYKNFTGYWNDQNILYPILPNQLLFYDWSQNATVRKATHVGNNTYIWKSKTVSKLMTDLGTATTPIVEKLLEDYRILFYNGQMDAIFPYTSSIELYRSFKWSGAEEFKRAKKEKIWSGLDFIGYRKIVKNLHEVLVRNAGHVASYDQLLWSSMILTEFTHS